MKVFTTLILQTICSLIFAHQFATNIYLQSFKNGKDTLEIGYDPNATRGVDVTYGEINLIGSNLSNKFRAFIVDPSIIQQSTFLLKKQIINTYTGWVENAALGIIVPFDSLPVTVSWNKSLFDNPERNFSLITDWTMGGWFDAGTYTFKANLKDVESVQIPKTVSNYMLTNGGQSQAMYIFYIAFAKQENIIMANRNVNYEGNIGIYPNPASEFINFTNIADKAINRINVFNTKGQLVESVIGSAAKINCSSWSNGLYFIQFEQNATSTYSKILIKK